MPVPNSDTANSVNCNDYSISSNGFIPFQYNSGNGTFQYEITTPYYIWYPNNLRSQMGSIPNITLVNTSETYTCGWYKIGLYCVKWICPGSIYLYLPPNYFDLNNSQIAAANLYISTTVGPIIENTYPWQETIFAIFLGLVLPVLCCITIYMVIKWKNVESPD